MKKISKKRHTPDRQRVHVAIVTILAFCILPVIVTIVLDFRRAGQETGEFLDIVSGEEIELPDDLEALLFPLDDFEVIGLSDDSGVLGFTSALPMGAACMEVDQGMKSTGWKALPSQGEGIITYSRESSSSGAESGYSYAIIVIEAVNEGTSIVVRLM
ncbi:MAG: hypothetical protein HGA54_04985 [Actinobacteria bacterium]|nr:hypothetical protein [Actinomycetota bacterium]